MFATLALAALIIEALVGYPDRLFAAIGRLIAWADARWNQPHVPADARRRDGVFALILVLGATAAISIVVVDFTGGMWPAFIGFLLTAALASSLIAQKSLETHVAAVADGLETGGLAGGRRAVSQIVGRDPDSLDEAGVARAAIESLAENFSDGVVAPLFWMVVAGLPGAALYKAINTADSMIGHKTARHLDFGRAAARLDDLVNLPASRLAAVWLTIAAFFLKGMAPFEAVAAVKRDARRHRSPNAGWPEAAIAGALGLKLAGPRRYHGAIVEDAFMGDGRAEATAADIRRALSLYRVACAIQALAIAALAGAVSLFG